MTLLSSLNYNYFMEKLIVTSLEKALTSLNTAQEKLKENPSDEFVRDSVIQRFEYTYALAVKYIQKYLEFTLPNPDDIDKLTFNELIRTANEKGILLNDLTKWTIYRQRRNITSHTYNLEKAQQVLDIITPFIDEVKYLLEQIK